MAPRQARRKVRRRFGPAVLAGVAALFLAVLLFSGYLLDVGKSLRTGASSTSPATTHVSLRRMYTVRPGDTLSLLARRFGVSQSLLIHVNHISNANVISVGERLIVPSAFHPGLTRALIASSARGQGIDPAFAQALAYQESGFNEDIVSKTGAVGVMQVEPGTAALVAGQTGRSYDLGVESDNIQVGVYWLAYLVRYYGGSERQAAAAYYEGQGNLAAHGYLSGTGQYVADVMALRQRFSGT